jgi:alpha-glucosidase
MMARYIIFLVYSLSVIDAFAQKTITVPAVADEYWWGAAVNEGEKMPFKPGYSLNLYAENKGNQAAPVLVSSKGRYIWSEQPFRFEITATGLVINATDSVYVAKAGNTLREAFVSCSKKFFPAAGQIPDTLLFSSPQYNTWIELLYNQNQADILKYAHAVIDNGFPPGVIMIDDYWAPHFGSYEFRKDRFPNAKAMTDELHRLGFKIMLWVCPFISPDTEIFREALQKRILLFDNSGDKNLKWEAAKTPAIIPWWDGYSAQLDFTNPAAVQWLKERLDKLVINNGVDGFKFDAGDMEYYPANIVSFEKATPNRFCELWGQFGLLYPLNEYRAMWKRGGQPLVQRLRDKYHTWEDLKKLIPHLATAGLMGYQFTCPDMIGGGDFSSFLNDNTLDQDLIVRSAQVHALMPMMQFSVAPWRVLDVVHLDAVKKAVAIRTKFTSVIMQQAIMASKTGEPFVTNLEYIFPGKGYEKVINQFMLGTNYMVAPMLEKGNKRMVIFPKGKWKADDGTIITGPVNKEIEVPLDRLPYFELLKK